MPIPYIYVTEAWQGLCDIGYQSETHLEPKSSEISFAINIRFSCPIVSKFCTEHDSDTATLCVKFQNDRAVEK